MCKPRFDERRRCRHCERGPYRWYRRGLCWQCYIDRDIRELYPVETGDLADLAAGRDLLCGGLPCEGPPPGEPGSKERVREFRRRYERRQRLWPARPTAWAVPGLPVDGVDGPDDAGCSMAMERIVAMLGGDSSDGGVNGVNDTTE